LIVAVVVPKLVVLMDLM